MRSFRRRDRGLSEIVGTLILILIVVSAATLLAAFVASYQKQLQSEQSYAHDQSLESIHILALSTVSNAAGTSFTSFSFELASEYVNPSSILGITINGDVIGPFTWTNLTTGLTGTYVVGENLELQPFDIVQVNLGLTCPGSSCSFPGAVPTPNTYLNFNVYTVLQNDFTRVFLPPVPLFVVSEINPTGGSRTYSWTGPVRSSRREIPPWFSGHGQSPIPRTRRPPFGPEPVRRQSSLPPC